MLICCKFRGGGLRAEREGNIRLQHTIHVVVCTHWLVPTHKLGSAEHVTLPVQKSTIFYFYFHLFL